MSGKLHIRPRDFLEPELTYIRGKLNEQMLPNLVVRKTHELQSKNRNGAHRRDRHFARTRQLLLRS